MMAAQTKNQQQQRLFGEGVKRTSGGEARRYNMLAARLISEMVKGLLGPCGMDKVFVDIMGEVTLTKDGATLLRKIDVEHPAAKVLIEASNAVDNAVGDGTTSVVVLAGALVANAEELLELGVLPSTISDGYRRALATATNALLSNAVKYTNSDRKTMERLAMTCMESKAISSCMEKERIAKLVVDAIMAVCNPASAKVEIDDVKVEQKPGSVQDTQLVAGVVIDKTVDSSAMPKSVENAKVLLIDYDLDKKNTRTDAEIGITIPAQIRAYLDEQAFELRKKVQAVIDSGANVVISRGGINTLAQTMLAHAGIMSVRRVKENDLWWLEKATGAKITRDLDSISQSDLGFAGRVCERFVGDDRMVFVEECRNPRSVTILLRAGSAKVLDEFHRSILDALNVLRDFVASPLVVAGGGAAEALAARAVRESARTVEGREQLAILKFADALEEIPLTIAANAGMDVIDAQAQLRAAGAKDGKGWCGVNAFSRRVQDDMLALGVIEPLAVKEQVMNTAAEVADLLLRVDDVVMAKPAYYTHTHSDGTTHSHRGGKQAHDHFDKLGRQQRPMHHYY
ncbi:chaperonin GroEL [Candidatus Nitrososphaera evergladensis SR1]|jgi:thermosome|uniref:Chaperonin GroEL n=1 Tax=Candidatus Nitrososphaera evergladensis SR1 TaxID=1459636 RepID=A0A075N0D1_9ARCH|nr:thermosome subunit alpha [Candidatus Nitrososphaera evergladensis]AIF84949.1 chaperonin GroEL [Candidatus Nitrososphaera evergladensis SR1]